MTNDAAEFVDALERYAVAAVAATGEAVDYCVEALEVVDARNHLFRPAGRRSTDEAHDIYALRELFRVDEDTMDFVPDRGRMAAIARNYF